MRFSRARYVTLCQQSLVTAAVLAVGLSAAGVKTLDIVPQPGGTAGARGSQPGTSGASSSEALADGPRTVEKSEVDSAPVTPRVREVAVSTPAPTSSPQSSARQAQPDHSTPTPKRGFVQTAPEKVQGYATIGLTWKHGVAYAEDQMVVTARTEDQGVWSKWMKVDYHDDHGPDAGSSEDASAKERPGTDALIVGDVDRVQVRAQTTTGNLPPDLKLAIVDPGTGSMTKEAPAIDTSRLPSATGKGSGSDPEASGVSTLEGEGTSDDVTLSAAMTRATRPTIYARSQWGANEKMREQSAPSYGTVKTGFIHHTVNANNYTRAQVPALLRGIYAYHTQSRGWRDIGYNYLVDRFGRIWEGRWGGVNRAVVGAHTLGYNEVSFAMSAIGNFDIARPPTAVLTAYAQLFAWKLSIYNIPANQTGIVVKGRRLQAINGHRDVGQTACPGRYLYAQLGTIRRQARSIQLAAQKGGAATPAPATPPPAFTSPTQQALPARVQPSNVAFPRSVNVAGSAYPDLVLKSSNGAIRVLPTGGQTGMRSGVGTPGPWASMTLLTAVNDVTGDGRGDVIGRSGGYTRIYRGDGAGHVSRTGAFPTRRFNRANLLVGAGDWNKDGKNDLLVRMRGNGALYLVPGTGRGTFGQSRLLARGWAAYTSTTVPGDVTGDRRPDLVAVKGGVMYVFPNVGVSRLGTPVRRQAVGSEYNAIVGGARDLSGDGVGDLMVRSSRSGQLGILVGKLRADWGSTLGWFDGAGGLKKLSSAQMSGSSQADLVGLNATGKQLVVMSNNGLVNTSGLLPGNLTVPGASMVINAGDWNRDGRGDIITREQNGDRLVLRPGLGNGQFKAGVVMSNGWSTFANIIGVNDVTGDRRPDLVARTASGPMTIFPGNGATGFQAPVLAPAKLRVFNQIGSGSWTSTAMPGSSFYGPGGAFVPFSGSTGGWLGRPYDWVVGPGDVNGDGVSDLVTRDTDGDLWLLPGTSSGYGKARFIASGFGGYTFIG